jgi:hypothetical protein
MILISELLPDVLADLPTCPDTLAEREIVKAAGQFARDTQAWTAVVVDDPEFIGGETLPSLPTDSRVVLIRSVEQNGAEVEYSWDGQAIEVDGGGALVVRASLEPTLEAVELPDALDPWADAIVARAQGRLLLQSAKPWTNAQLGMERLQEYREQVQDAKLRVALGGSDAPLRVRAHHNL